MTSSRMRPRVFQLDPERRYSVAIRLGERTLRLDASPMDSAGTRWNVEGLGEIDASFDEIHFDAEEIVEFRATVTAHVSMETAGVHSPAPRMDEQDVSMKERIRLWASRPGSNVHKIIALVVASPGGLVRHDLVRRVQKATSSANPYGAVASLMTSAGNAYGRALIDDDGIVSIHPDVRDEVARHKWIV